MRPTSSSNAPPGTPAPEPTPASDLELVRDVLAGDSGAFTRLGERLREVPRLIAAANRRMSRPLERSDLEDAAQDALVKIWEKLPTFEGRSTLEGWAWRFCVFELRNRTRAAASRRHHVGQSIDAVETEPAAPAQDPMPYESEELNAALDKLPPEMAEVIRLKHDEGIMFKEISARLGIADSTAKTRYYRGIAQLRAALPDRGMDRGGAQDPDRRGGQRR